MDKLIFLVLFVPLAANADWILDQSRSEISFISIKNQSISETHKLRKFEGSVDSDGNLIIKIDLDSLDSGIPIRDERMRKILFETVQFEEATISSQIDLSFSKDVSIGEIQQRSENFTLDLHGKKSISNAHFGISLGKDGSVRVDSIRPVIISASVHNLVDGLDALRLIAKLTSIGQSVPVSFNLFFSKKVK